LIDNSYINYIKLFYIIYIRIVYQVGTNKGMFRAFSRPTSGAQQLQPQPLVLPLERGGSSAVGRVLI